MESTTIAERESSKLEKINSLFSLAIDEDSKKDSSFRGIASTYRKFVNGKSYGLDSFKKFLLSENFKSSTKENLYNYLRSVAKRKIQDEDSRELFTGGIASIYNEAIQETRKSKNRIETQQESMHYGKDYLRIEDIKMVCEYLYNKPASNKFNTDIDGNKKLSLIIRFLFMTGVRINELIQIRLDEITLNGVATIQIHGKGSNGRKAKIDREFYSEIVSLFNGKEFLFESKTNTQFKPQNLWKKISDSFLECGYGNKNEMFGEKFYIHPHTMRHSFAMHKLENGMDIKTVSYLLGHKDITITLRTYIHPDTDKYKELILNW